MSHSGQTGITFTSGGHTLLGRLFLAPGDDPKPTALILHGVPGIEQNHDIAHALRESGWNAAIFHYRGCWGSEGLYTLKTLPDDAIAALDYLSAGRRPQVDPDRLVLIGHSMGGWTAVMAAARDPRPKAVAVIGAVTDPAAMPQFADESLAAQEFTPWLPGLSPAAFAEQWRGLDGAWSAVAQAHKIAPRPLLIIHAQPDADVPASQSEALHAQARDPKQMILHPEANHSFTWHRRWLRKTLLDWLNTLPSING